MAANSAPQLNPGIVFDTLGAYHKTVALKGAIDLDLFTLIGDGVNTVPALVAKLDAQERGVRILCDYLTIIEFLTKQNGVYALTPDSAAFLNKRSPMYMGSMAGFLAHEELVSKYLDVAGIIRNGVGKEDVGSQVENPIWVEFARSMAPMGAMQGRSLAPLVTEPGKPIKVLDIAASHGMYGINIALHNPAAQIVALDWANVLQVSIENARALGISDRHQTIPGNVNEVDLGTGYDLVLITNFLHMFDRAHNVKLLKKVHAALKPGGQVATVEFVPNEDRISPVGAATFSFTMLGATEGGDAYTFRQLDQMFREAGFGESRIQDLPQSPEQVVLTKK